ncbi:transglycosylase SLT domain-containing protein [bacterium]|nr:transglycosylase SLT domain-containing protein [bacterium]
MKPFIALSVLFALSGCNNYGYLSFSPSQKTNTDDTPSVAVTKKPISLTEAFSMPYKVLPETTLESKGLWQKLQASLILEVPEALAPQINTIATKQTQLPGAVTNMLDEASPYLYYITNEIEKRKLPKELALIPLVESNFNPNAYSHMNAAGLWQFMPMTAQRFKLDNNHWVDERKDIVASTNAALDYLEYLNDFFDGDWLLAMAAYNAGEGTVQRAVRRNKKMGLATDFASLKLPRETTAYIPKVLAWAQILRQPTDYNLSLKHIADQPHFVALDMGEQVKFSTIAELADISKETLTELNPAFKQNRTDPLPPHQLLIPADKAHIVAIALADKQVYTPIGSIRYTIKVGDSLGAIAETYGISINSIIRANTLKKRMIHPGQVLIIPSKAPKLASSNRL